MNLPISAAAAAAAAAAVAAAAAGDAVGARPQRRNNNNTSSIRLSFLHQVCPLLNRLNPTHSLVVTQFHFCITLLHSSSFLLSGNTSFSTTKLGLLLRSPITGLHMKAPMFSCTVEANCGKFYR